MLHEKLALRASAKWSCWANGHLPYDEWYMNLNLTKFNHSVIIQYRFRYEKKRAKGLSPFVLVQFIVYAEVVRAVKEVGMS